MRNWGKLAVVTLALAVGLSIAGPAAAQSSPAENQYGQEPPPAAPTPTAPTPAAPTPAAPTPDAPTPDAPTPDAEPQVEPQAAPEIFLPPTVASAGQEESDSSGLLPFTGAALIVPSLLGGLLLAGGLFLVHRTRRREEI